MNSRRKGAEGERSLCRKLREYGYEARRGQQFSGARPKYRWPATVYNGRADKEDWQSYTIDRKTEPTISKMEQVDEPQTERMTEEEIDTMLAKVLVGQTEREGE